jgi:hypothetical protein
MMKTMHKGAPRMMMQIGNAAFIDNHGTLDTNNEKSCGKSCIKDYLSGTLGDQVKHNIPGNSFPCYHHRLVLERSGPSFWMTPTHCPRDCHPSQSTASIQSEVLPPELLDAITIRWVILHDIRTRHQVTDAAASATSSSLYATAHRGAAIDDVVVVTSSFSAYFWHCAIKSK